jgi:hypothetical protein
MSTQFQHNLLDSPACQQIVLITKTTSNYNKNTTPVHQHQPQKHQQDTQNQHKTSTTTKLNQSIAKSTNHNKHIDHHSKHEHANTTIHSNQIKLTQSSTNTTTEQSRIKLIFPRQMKKLLEDSDNQIICSIMMLPKQEDTNDTLPIQLNTVQILDGPYADNNSDKNNNKETKEQEIKHEYNEHELKIHKEFADIFKSMPPGLPPRRAHDRKIETIPGSTPPSKAPYRLSPSELDELKKQLAHLLEMGFVRPSRSVRTRTRRTKERGLLGSREQEEKQQKRTEQSIQQ